jgi:hypothetical protein
MAIIGKKLGRLEVVDLRSFWADEAGDFTPWLAQSENLSLLSATLGMELEREGVEVHVGQYKADIVARDISSNARVIIENQLEKTNHDHLGKTLTYASGLDAKVIIWISRKFTDEHRRALDFLNENAAPNLRFFGIEMQLWRIGNSDPAPLFRIVSSPNEYSPTALPTADGGLSETKSLYLDFWTKFQEYCEQQGTLLGLRKPRAQHWFSIAVGRSKFHISLTASIQHQRIGCEIYIRGSNAKLAFKQLEQQKEAIEAQTGPLEWQELPQGQDCRIIRYRTNLNLTEVSVWPEAFSWLKQEAERFYKVFSPRIKQLPLVQAEGVYGDSNQEESSEAGEDSAVPPQDGFTKQNGATLTPATGDQV